MFSGKWVLTGFVARADEGECGELAENACFYTAGYFVVQVSWACGGRIPHQIWHRWHDLVKGRSELSGIWFLYSWFWTCLHILKHIWLQWLKCFSSAPKNMFVDPERSTVFDFLLNCWTSLEMPKLLDRSHKLVFIYITLLWQQVLRLGLCALMIAWHLYPFYVF